MGMLNYMDTSNPWAAALDGITKGFMNGQTMMEESNTRKAELAQKNALMQIQQDAADRLKRQDAANAVAQQALQERLAPKSAPMQMGLLGSEANNPYGMANLIDPASVQMPRTMVDAKPMDMNETRNFILSHAGTPSAETAYKMAQMGQKDELNASKLDNLKEMLTLRQDMQQQLANAKNEVEREKIKSSYDAKIIGYENALKLKAMPSIVIHQGNGQQPKPMPAAALRMQNDDLEAIGTLSNLNNRLLEQKALIDSGKISLGLVANNKNRALNALGMSTEDSRNYATLQANLEKMRNDSLRLNKGVQTEGDAVRAWNEIAENINDSKLVSKRLAEIAGYNDDAAKIKSANISNIRANYNLPEVDTNAYKSKSQGALQNDAMAELARRRAGRK